MNFIDNFLNRITMYRLVLYYLLGLWLVAVLFAYFNLLPYTVSSLLFSLTVVTAVCWVSNFIFSRIFEAPTNIESLYITALILTLIVSPIQSIQDFYLLFWAGVLSMASKYILAINKKHIFNPVAIALVLTDFFLNAAPSWWVGTAVMAPFVLSGGLLLVKKIQREDLVAGFLVAAIATVSGFVLSAGSDLISALRNLTFNSSFFFLAFVMLTEPLTTPSINSLQIAYGVLVGVLFAPQLHFGSIYSTPELALSLGNIFSYLVSPKIKLALRVKEKIPYGGDIIDFIFNLEKKLTFLPGQYMEWTLPHSQVDSRGNRRYFTIASSPTEDTLHLGVKFYRNGSSYKRNLVNLNRSGKLVGGQLAGDFTLPKNPRQKCVFIAGGIGITPFRSMIKYLLDKRELRDIVLFYANRKLSEIAYADVFEQARKQLGIKTVYSLTDKDLIAQGWQGRAGRINAEMIKQEVPDFIERKFYLSGSHSMVENFEKTLQAMGIRQVMIKKDFFPGLV